VIRRAVDPNGAAVRMISRNDIRGEIIMSGKDNIETIKNVYAAFGRGDVATILDAVTADVDWASDTASDGAPWYGARAGKAGVGSFFDDFGKAMEVEEFTPLTFAANADGDVLTVVRFVARSRETGRAASMQLHHWFRFTDGKISYYRGTEDTAITIDMLT
jgi:ketosteroid isomerase-like protein